MPGLAGPQITRPWERPMNLARILIVDDSEPMRRTIRSLLQKVAIEFRDCSDGDEVEAAYAEFRPDWVVMDVKMGRVDGIEAMRRLLKIHPDAKVVINTSFDEPGLERAAREAGAREWMRKEDLWSLRKLIGEEDTRPKTNDE